ncbi:hypothetical protein V1511DRAFT_505430 [Dipodascopsis uninucleata]
MMANVIMPQQQQQQPSPLQAQAAFDFRRQQQNFYNQQIPQSQIQPKIQVTQNKQSQEDPSYGSATQSGSTSQITVQVSSKKQRPVVERALKRSIDNDVKFAFDPFLRKEYQFGIDPKQPICKKFLQGKCELGMACPDRHVQPSAPNRVVCKHWLRGLCKKGDSCEFLHEYNLRKMPECTFYARNGFCTQSPDCLYLHIDPQSRIPPCQNYERGFCKLGPECPKRHIRRTMCELYLVGFCPKGPDCENVHPKWSFLESLRIKSKNDKPSTPYPESKDNRSRNDGGDNVIKVLR